MTALALVVALHVVSSPVVGIAGFSHQVTGVATGARDSAATLRLRDGRTIYVDASAAKATHQQAVFVAGQAYLARGAFDRAGVFEATSVVRSKDSPALWSPDR